LHASSRRVHPSLGAAHSAQRLRQVALFRRVQLSASGGLPQPLSRTVGSGATYAGPCGGVPRAACRRVPAHAALSAVPNPHGMYFARRASGLEAGLERSPPARVVRSVASGTDLGLSPLVPRTRPLAHASVPPHHRPALLPPTPRNAGQATALDARPRRASFTAQFSPTRSLRDLSAAAPPVASGLRRLLNCPWSDSAAH
jgi:hypothetical protein